MWTMEHGSLQSNGEDHRPGKHKGKSQGTCKGKSGTQQEHRDEGKEGYNGYKEIHEEGDEGEEREGEKRT